MPQILMPGLSDMVHISSSRSVSAIGYNGSNLNSVGSSSNPRALRPPLRRAIMEA